MFYAFKGEFKRSEITWLKPFEKQRLRDGHDEREWGADSDTQVFKKHFLSCASSSVLLLLSVSVSLGQPKVGCEKRGGVGHTFSFESFVSWSPAVSESKENIRKTVALVISTLRQNAKQNLQ